MSATTPTRDAAATIRALRAVFAILAVLEARSQQGHASK